MKAVTEAARGPQTRVQNAITLGCLGVMAFLYLAAVCNVVVPWMGYSAQGVFNLLVLTATTAAAAATYLQCLYCDPGRAPTDWQPDAEQQGAAGVMQVKRSGGGKRYCKKCRSFKPPRTHHCRRCGHCVLRMDHHCVWVNNCIGHGNHRAFLLMAAYLAAACLHALGLLLAMDAHLVQVGLGWDEESRIVAAAGGSTAGMEAAAGGSAAAKTGWHGPFWLHAVVQVLATALGLPVAVGLTILLIWNAYLCLRNQTTIEYHEGVVAQYMQPGGSGGGHPFDLGWHDNLHAVCGDNVACWPLPGRTAAQGDGVHFPTPWDRG